MTKMMEESGGESGGGTDEESVFSTITSNIGNNLGKTLKKGLEGKKLFCLMYCYLPTKKVPLLRYIMNWCYRGVFLLGRGIKSAFSRHSVQVKSFYFYFTSNR